MIKTFFKNSFIYTIGTILTRGIGVLLVPIYTRYLSPSEYGIIDLFMILTSIISLTIALEIHQAVVRFYQDTACDEEKTEYVSTAFIFTIAVYSVYFVISFLFSNTFTLWLLNDTKYESIFLLATGAIFTSGLFYFTHGQLRWQIMPKASTVVSVLQLIIVACVSVYLLVFERLKIESIFIGQIIGNIFGTMASILYARKSYQFIFVYDKLKELISFSYPLVFSGVAIFIALFVDRIAIKYFLGLDQLGIYGLAYRFAAVASLVMVGFQSSLMPLIYKHYKEKETPENIAKLFKVFSIFAISIIAGVILFSKEVVILMATKEYYSAAPMIPMLVAAVFFTNMYIFAPGLSIEKKTKVVAFISIAGAVINTVLNLTLIPVIGIEGAALATLNTAIIIFIIRVRMSNRYYFVPHIWHRLFFGLLFSMFGAILVNTSLTGISLENVIFKIIFYIILSFLIGFYLLEKKVINVYAKRIS